MKKHQLDQLKATTKRLYDLCQTTGPLLKTQSALHEAQAAVGVTGPNEYKTADEALLSAWVALAALTQGK